MQFQHLELCMIGIKYCRLPILVTSYPKIDIYRFSPGSKNDYFAQAKTMSMKKRILLLTFLLFAGTIIFAQVGINNDGNLPHNSAMFDADNPTRGILITRTIPHSITAPATGLLINNIGTNRLNFFNGTQWSSLCAVYTGITGAGGSQHSIGMAVKT